MEIQTLFNHMTPHNLMDAGSQTILGDCDASYITQSWHGGYFHSGGMHRLMAWHGPMLTDSGSFQDI